MSQSFDIVYCVIASMCCYFVVFCFPYKPNDDGSPSYVFLKTRVT